MAEERSQILTFQDKNNDGYHDDCPEIEFEEVRECPTCKPNPNAIVDDWKKVSSGDAWLNQKSCDYQVTIIASESTLLPNPKDLALQDISDEEMEVLAAENVDELFSKYKEKAIKGLFDQFNKEDTEENRALVSGQLENTKYDLDPRFSSRVKLLYSVNYDTFAPIPSAEADEQPDKEDQKADIVVKFNASEIPEKMLRFQKAMLLYSRYYRIYSAVEGGVITFIQAPKAGKVFTKGQFDNYAGGSINKPNSLTMQFVRDLDDWLNRKGMNIMGFGGFLGGINNPNKSVVDLEFTFDSEYKLKKMRAWTENCSGEGKPKTYYASKSLGSLARRPAWRDATLCAYFTRIMQIDRDLQARVPMPWTEFIVKHTWPQVQEDFNLGYQKPTASPDNPTTLSCIGDALEAEGKQLGQDILDEVMSIGDAVASAFNKNMCKEDWDPEVLEEGVKLGQVWDPESEQQVSVIKMAKEQAFNQLYADEQIFTRLCAQMLEQGLSRAAQSFGDVMSPEAKIDGFTRPLKTIKQCGMFDLLLGAIECLMKGLSLQEALKKMVNKALSNMDVESFGELFVGLPENKQKEIEALVYQQMGLQHPDGVEAYDADAAQRQIKEEVSGAVEKSIKDHTDATINNIKDKAESVATGVADSVHPDLANSLGLGVPAKSKVTIAKPWTDPEYVEKTKKSSVDGGGEKPPVRRTLPECEFDPSEITPGSGPGGRIPDISAPRNIREQIESGEIKLTVEGILQIDPGVILEAYITAMIEVYKDNLLDLVDELNRFPYAPVIAGIIATVDCPHPPVIQPSLMDFINSIDIPFCTNIDEIVLPGLNNPFWWLADLWDAAKLLFQVLKMVIMQIIMNIIIMILVKLCQLIGDAICKALEIAGDIAQSLPAIIRGETSFSEVIRENICGPDADEAQVQDTITEMFEKLGVGGAALADRDAVQNFTRDLSSGVTSTELSQAMLGDAPQAFLDIADGLVEYEYPQFRDGLANKLDIADFFANIGNLLPADVKNSMQNMINEMPEAAKVPANPSLCASPAALEGFENLRCELLQNRATPAQCREMFDNLQDENLQNLEDIADIVQKGIPQALADALPPIVSTPGCDDGLIPFESEDAQKVAGAVLGDDLKRLKTAYAKDMIGDGGFLAGDASWGMLNMVLSDTNGIPLTSHQDRTANRNRNVDFAIDQNPTFPQGLEWMNALIDPVPTEMQRGMYPAFVAEWLREQMAGLNPSFNTNNEFEPEKTITRTYSQIGLATGLFAQQPSLLQVPDFGYNVVYYNKPNQESLDIIKKGRKSSPDLTLSFTNGRRGRVQHENKPWSWGFDASLYLSDMRNEGDGAYNVFSDNARVKITDKLNFAALFGETRITNNRKYEFVSVDDTLERIDTSQYPKFLDSFASPNGYIPQINLLREMTEKAVLMSTSSELNVPDIEALKEFYDNMSNALYRNLINEVVNNNVSWEYGAVYDDLTEEDIEYVVKSGQTDSPGGTLYSDAKINGAAIENDDNVLGISRMQFEEEAGRSDRPNRVFYLSPAQFGGSYVLPPIYIKPIENKGWLGVANALFPELSPCKPSKSDLVDFADISDEIQQAYNSIPEDERLKEAEGCSIEVPYNRVLMRPAKAGIQGIIAAACRIFTSAHFVQGMSTFTTFAPKFTENYSSLYATYIVENMERSFKDAQSSFWELFNTFKDEEFWYAFLEQSVQTYGRLVKNGDIKEPPVHVLCAMGKINDLQEGFYVRDYGDLLNDKFAGDVSMFTSFKEYKGKYNLMAVQRSEEYAKIVLKEMVITELNAMGEKFVQNFEAAGLTPKYDSMDFYLLTALTNGGENLTLNKKVEPEIVGLPLSGSGLYTDGGELSTQPEGLDYVGYYHIHIKEDGTRVYMEGEEHSSKAHSELSVYAQQKIVKIGDVPEYGSKSAELTTEKFLSGENGPFMIEKYISINGLKMSTEEAYAKITSRPGNPTIHQAYPGTLKLITQVVDGVEQPIGIQGQMGVRYGLELSIAIDGKKYTLTSVEIDALDVPVNQFKKLNGDSTQLLCLLNLLKNTDTYKLLSQYVVGVQKATAMIAIYNDYGFLPSLGEFTVGKGDVSKDSLSAKPGMAVNLDEDGRVINYEMTPGWEFGSDRKPLWWTWSTLEFDDWDQVILRNSKRRIKSIFKRYYNLRHFKAQDLMGDMDPAKMYIKNLKAGLQIPAGAQLLPWWMKPLLRSNPYNSNGELCKK